jgi:hypothetical protein
MYDLRSKPMTVLLEEAFDKVSKLPETLQDEIAKELLADIEAGSHIRWERMSERVKKLVENGQVDDARKVLSTIQPGVSTTLDKWQNALAEPKAILDKPAAKTNIKEDARWLHNNSEKYSGKWIALKNGKLLGTHESRLKLRHTLKQAAKLPGAMFFRIDN